MPLTCTSLGSGCSSQQWRTGPAADSFISGWLNRCQDSARSAPSHWQLQQKKKSNFLYPAVMRSARLMSQVNKGEIMSHAWKEERRRCQSGEVKPTAPSGKAFCLTLPGRPGWHFNTYTWRPAVDSWKYSVCETYLTKKTWKTTTAEDEEKQGKLILFVS